MTRETQLTSNPPQDYIDQAVKRYSSLFTLPSHGRLLFLTVLLCVLGGEVTLLPFVPPFYALAIGLSFFVVTIFSDFVVCWLIRSEPIFNLRRCNALSFVSCLVWFGLMFLGTVFGFYFQSADVWFRFFLLGFSAVSLLRLLVFTGTLFKGLSAIFVSAMFEPVLWTGFLFATWPFVRGAPPAFSSFVFALVSVPVVLVTAALFVYLINRVGKKTLGISSMTLLRTFLVNWVEDINGPMENVLEKLGTEQSVDVSLLSFKTKANVKALLVIPALHPGPFKNVGSSTFPSLLQEALEKKLKCTVSVPHGLFGHELDLASQAQNHKVINQVLNSLQLNHAAEEASEFERVQSGVANASCQIYGDKALLTLTVAPETTEDLPQELGFLAIEEAKKRGLESAVVVNAHNSIDSTFRLEEALAPLREAVTKSIDKASKGERSSLKVGAAKIVPEEFGIEAGMGPGGITVIVTRVNDQTAAYITFDGNNMVSGLREKILTALNGLGIDDGEVLTTDTHEVSAVVLNRRGYHPIGEVMDHDKLINHLKSAVSDALANLESVEASWQTITVPNVKVIGAKHVEALCTMTDNSMKRAKRAALTLFPIAGVVLVALLLLA